MAGDLAIRCTDVSKVYRRYSRRRKFQTLKSALLGGELLASLSPADSIRALEPLDLSVPKGQALGIIGSNGSGKSTLMKIIYGTTKPTTGSVLTQGRVSALIELGAGFHPEISGRENVVINGIMLGLSRREVERRFDEIVSFAELHEFIDAPVKTYSSGMYARLGFAVAISVRPDVLLIDEVLAVGDEAFSHKCTERIRALKAEGRTLVLVTHDLSMVEKLCDRSIWLKQGRVLDDGEPRRVIDAYRMDVARHEEVRLGREQEGAKAVLEVPPEPPPPPPEVAATMEPKRWGSREVEIEAVELLGREGSPRHVFASGEGIEIRMRVRPRVPVSDFVFGVGIFAEDGRLVFGTNTQIERLVPESLHGPAEVSFGIEALDLVEGTYHVDVAVHRGDGAPYDYHRHLYSLRVTSEAKDVGVYRPRHAWRFGGEVKLRDAVR